MATCENTGKTAVCSGCGEECDCVFTHRTHTHTCYSCGLQEVFR